MPQRSSRFCRPRVDVDNAQSKLHCTSHANWGRDDSLDVALLERVEDGTGVVPHVDDDTFGKRRHLTVRDGNSKLSEAFKSQAIAWFRQKRSR